jgi:hypothetical protein
MPFFCLVIGLMLVCALVFSPGLVQALYHPPRRRNATLLAYGVLSDCVSSLPSRSWLWPRSTGWGNDGLATCDAYAY